MNRLVLISKPSINDYFVKYKVKIKFNTNGPLIPTVTSCDLL